MEFRVFMLISSMSANSLLKLMYFVFYRKCPGYRFSNMEMAITAVEVRDRKGNLRI